MGRVLIVVVIVVAAIAGWLLWNRRSAPHHEASVTRPRGSAGRATVSGQETAPRRRISGTVVQDGRGIRATVRAVAEDGPAPIEIQTDDNGAFSFSVPADRYWLAASAPNVARSGTNVDVRDADRTNVVLALHACARDLAGSITDSSGGAPIEGARIDGGWAVTDKNGRFRICDDNEQTNISVDAEGFASEMRHLMPDDNNVDFALTPEAPLSGIVVGPDHEPIAGVRVRLNPSMRRDRGASSSRSSGALAISGSDGRFVMHGLGAGSFDVWIGSDDFVLAEPITVTLKIAANPELVIPLRAGDLIRGVARVDGKPLADASITWMPENGNMVTAPSAADGTFEMRNATYGRGTFAVDHYDTVRDVLVGTLPVTLDLHRAMEIHGRVVHAGTPVAGAEVSGAGIPATSDEKGEFVVQVLEAGTYPLMAQSELIGGFSADTPVLVKEGQVVEGIVLDISFEASISGVVVDQNGAPIAGAHVVWLDHALNDEGTAIAHADGSFRAAKLSGGKGVYEATVTLDGRELPPVGGVKRTVAVPGPKASITGERIAVVLRRSTIAGLVVDDAGAPIPDAAVESRGVHARSDVDGRFTLAVVEGAYSLRVMGPPGMQAFVPDVAAGTKDLRIVLRQPGSVHVTCPGAPADADVDLFTAGNTIEHAVACGSTVHHVSEGLVTGRSRDGSLVAQATVRPAATAELVMQPTEKRAVRVTVTHDGAPVAQASCIADYAPAAYLATDELTVKTSAAGIATFQMPRLVGRVHCMPPPGTPWNAAQKLVEPTSTEVALELR